MKFCWFHLMPYRHLPADFEQKYNSVWVDVPSKLFDPKKGHALYNEFLDELEFADQVGFAFRSVLTRRPNEFEMQSLTSTLNEYEREFSQAPEAVTKLLSSGESPRDDELDSSQLAAWTMITHLLLNLSETVTKE